MVIISFGLTSQVSFDWATQMDQVTSGAINVYAVEHDPSGNVFVAGSFKGTSDFDVSSAGGTLVQLKVVLVVVILKILLLINIVQQVLFCGCKE